MWISKPWIKLKSLCQDASYRRLALALGLSFFLHLFLIGKFSFNLPNLNEQRDLIEARLVLPKALPSPLQNPPVGKKPVAKHAEANKPAKIEEEKPVEPVAPANPLPTELTPADTATPMEPPEDVQPIVEHQEEAGLMTKPKPYQYIESEFAVYTDKGDVDNRAVAGSARVIYQRMPNGEQYQIKSLIQAKGLISLVIPDLLQTSDGYFDELGLQPAHYLYQFGNKKDKTFSADFNWRSKKLTLHSQKGDQTFNLQDGTQDLLSFMYQFMFVPPLQNMQLNITNGKKLGVYDYTFEGEETLTTKLGDIKTVHISRMASEGEKKTELWLALDYQHVPVKIRETSGDGKMYELVITSLDARLEPLPLP
ncbi:DUF3108 domain-containing protein [Methylotenera sp.]|uniref:DUF3108 domain-containing protein n=1 Tax=Methylotenera sp. TaxID=2051956 RepID=UPI002488ABDA|nr:DUF3108 domain-containing protein [Methylotenera sp.]MDI1363062.1 DUF3108 domain-containing protein [Methylotenera sp.]